MNGKKVAAFIALIIFIDQAIKFYIKLNYFIGEEHAIIGAWARLHFVENEGMAWGLKFGGGFGKIILTLLDLEQFIYHHLNYTIIIY
jgi:signal peptidase II